MKGRLLCAIGRTCTVFAIALACETWNAQTPARTVKPENPAVAEWEGRTSSIQKSLEESDEQNCRGAPPAGIVDAFGVGTDELSVALVNFCGRGAYTDYIVVMRMDRGKPVLAKFRDAKGKKVENGFARGASVMHSVDVKLVPERKAIYDSFANNDAEGRPDKCGVKAYVWNTRNKTFDLNLPLSKSASEEYCRSLREKK
jgi:hypothetical protein